MREHPASEGVMLHLGWAIDESIFLQSACRKNVSMAC